MIIKEYPKFMARLDINTIKSRDFIESECKCYYDDNNDIPIFYVYYEFSIFSNY